MPLDNYHAKSEEASEEFSLWDLLQTLQDCIFIARKLGISYVWIDSICIVQDSPNDW